MNEANKCFSGSAVNRYFINQTVCPAFVIIFKVIINHGSLSNLTMVWLDKPKQPRSQEVKKKGTHTHWLYITFCWLSSFFLFSLCKIRYQWKNVKSFVVWSLANSLQSCSAFTQSATKENLVSTSYQIKATDPNITHLAFADDIMVFFDGEKQSLDHIAQTFEAFSRWSGLTMNKTKTELYAAGLNL